MSLGTVHFDFSGTTDANGNLSVLNKNVSPAQWAAVKVVGASVGGARWTVRVSGVARCFSVGDRIDDATYLQPSQTVDVLVEGAQANQPVTGVISGISGDSLEEIAPFIVLVPDATNVNTASPTILLGNVIAPAQAGGGSASGTFTLPPGTQAVGFNWDETGPNSAPTSVRLLGQPTQTTYLSVGGSGLGATGGLEIAPIASGVDTQVQVNVNSPNNLQSKVYVMAWIDVPAVFVRVIDGTALPVKPGAESVVNTSGNIGTGSIAGGASSTAIAGVLFKETRLHKVWFTVIGVAGVSGTVECPAGTVRANWDGSFTHAVDLDFEGLDCGSGSDVVIHNTSGVASGAINGYATANQV